jgi:hypothetical protein
MYCESSPEKIWSTPQRNPSPPLDSPNPPTRPLHIRLIYITILLLASGFQICNPYFNRHVTPNSYDIYSLLACKSITLIIWHLAKSGPRNTQRNTVTINTAVCWSHVCLDTVSHVISKISLCKQVLNSNVSYKFAPQAESLKASMMMRTVVSTVLW